MNQLLSWLWIFPAAWCVLRWRSSVKKPPRLESHWFSETMWGEILEEMDSTFFFQHWCVFVLCFSFGNFWNISTLVLMLLFGSFLVFQLCLAKGFPTCFDHQFLSWFLGVSGCFFLWKLVETASYYPFTDLSTSKNMSLRHSMSCIINHKFAPVNM